MNLKQIILGIVVLTVFILGGIVIMNNSEQPQILEDIKEAKPNSEYVKCLEEVEEREEKYLQTLTQCKTDKLAEQGYTDGINCIGDFENPVCDHERYNAQVSAYNECNKLYPVDKTALTQWDCLELR